MCCRWFEWSSVQEVSVDGKLLKLLTLAFDKGANENEAVNAFRAARALALTLGGIKAIIGEQSASGPSRARDRARSQHYGPGQGFGGRPFWGNPEDIEDEFRRYAEENARHAQKRAEQAEARRKEEAERRAKAEAERRERDRIKAEQERIKRDAEEAAIRRAREARKRAEAIEDSVLRSFTTWNAGADPEENRLNRRATDPEELRKLYESVLNGLMSGYNRNKTEGQDAETF